MSLYQVKPLHDRTGFTGKHKTSPFDSPWSSTLDVLRRELTVLGAKNTILELNVLPGSIRLDGELYANAKVTDPAVRLHFDSKHGHLTYQTDRFHGWRDNVRAIALGLEALRRIDRYGIGRGDEQYQGWLALEAGTGATPLGATPRMTWDDATAVIKDVLGLDYGAVDWADPDQSHAAYRLARALVHPDRHDGDRTAWDRLEAAAKVLGL